ncbi:hypothetical protein BKA57DRAFT_497363 [Linnemannia elongata]|nr:hypothetical protein BGZ88_006495 [Linnemannia elongata]KAG0068359.1 hypothetical protein BGZ89_004877 [Linnemannia elongata]KAH7032420.1 hypothetical protein BKA57DRAFT_497363 [Linnemannia elongata]KAK5805499.1 hypothetical protein F5H01DRAFT_416982 [Linnemannia elongata]
MHKSSLLLLALATLNSALALGDWQFVVTNNAGRSVEVPVAGKRHCVCLETSQTSKIKNTNGGVMKLFSTSDCTGNYAVLSKGATRSNAQWVNSASVGQDGIPSSGPNDCSPIFGFSK